MEESLVLGDNTACKAKQVLVMLIDGGSGIDRKAFQSWFVKASQGRWGSLFKSLRRLSTSFNCS